MLIDETNDFENSVEKSDGIVWISTKPFTNSNVYTTTNSGAIMPANVKCDGATGTLASGTTAGIKVNSSDDYHKIVLNITTPCVLFMKWSDTDSKTTGKVESIFRLNSSMTYKVSD